MYSNDQIQFRNLQFVNKNPLTKKLMNNQISQNQKPNAKEGKPSIPNHKKVSKTNFKAKHSEQLRFQQKLNPSNKSPRSWHNFINEQQKFITQKQQKINKLRQHINRNQEDETTGKPTIINHSRQLASNLNTTVRSTNIFKRLQKEKQYSHHNNQQTMFSPKILDRSKSIARTQNVSTLLYEDAKRRQQKQHFLQQQNLKKIEVSPIINANTNALVGRKICSQYTDLVTDEQMSPLVAISVLSEIFNIDLNPNKSASTAELAKKILKYVGLVHQADTIKSQRLWLFIQTILHGHLTSTCFSEQEQRQIYSQFQYFYNERLTKQKKPANAQRLSFKPTTLASSSKLAESYRDKACQNISSFIQHQHVKLNIKDGNLTLEDLFILDHHKKQINNQKKRIELENQQLEKCTFKPDLTNSSLSIKNIHKKPKILIKVPLKSRLRIGKTKLDIDTSMIKSSFIENKKIRSRKNSQKENSNGNLSLTLTSKDIKDVEKVMMRMSIGRQTRQFSKKILERGYPKGYNWDQYRKQMHRESIQNNKKLKGYNYK